MIRNLGKAIELVNGVLVLGTMWFDDDDGQAYVEFNAPLADGTEGRFVQIAGWPTPQAFDGEQCDRSPEARARARKKGGCANLREIAELVGPPPQPSSFPPGSGKCQRPAGQNRYPRKKG